MNPNYPIVYLNKFVRRVPFTYQGYQGFVVETCPVCGKGIARADKLSVIQNGQHWHIHKMCSKLQHTIVKVKED